MATDLIVRTTSGDLRGARGPGGTVFRGVPYAAPPVGDLRFAPPRPAAAWTGVRDAIADGPVAPQGRSRLAHVMGDFTRPQSEDCLTLNVWAPVDASACPVMVWFHGGAFSSGAGSLPWYSGASLAANGRVVVVSINYRLGALGFLCLPGISDGNLGLLDQVQALRWVRDNIRVFGGDPDAVTVFGQSAGAGSIAALMTMPEVRGLFRRAILQSTPFGRLTRTREDAHRVGERFLGILGLTRETAGQLKTLPVPRFIEAHGELARLEKTSLDVAAPFGLTVDGSVIRGDIAAALKSGSAAGIDMMIGTTREEMTAFFSVDKDAQTADPATVDAMFARVFKLEPLAYRDEYRRMRASPAPAALLGDLFSDRVFRMGSLRLAEGQAAHGHAAYVYQFDWQSPAGFAACHCLEIPFVHGNLADWADSPMLNGADAAEIAGLSQAMQQAWLAFVRTGDPNHGGLPRWDPYRLPERTTMRFDSVIGPVSDLAGVSWRRPWPV